MDFENFEKKIERLFEKLICLKNAARYVNRDVTKPLFWSRKIFLKEVRSRILNILDNIIEYFSDIY